ncbi:hypothetical protein ACFQ3P_32700 [Paraburkholderia sabiae]|uniref:Uncharacterized protein n=1 Tax=Paraburkholderia sabiae TaxID=273251 RepID=A0ABU9QJG7_9BURK|nr:hypothetical protein [Paraburkholderia sabiae]WJZ80020.1 hypothetical protein QEN71_43525 [Paraburkholderia sabiae]CAD6559498.1 hypothetical protein LMG24235_06692 [Paraburkholderia sabiae]
MRPAHELNQIAGFGGGFIISADQYTVAELNQMAGFAAASGARITLKNCGHLALVELNQIAGFGRGTIVFDLSD